MLIACEGETSHRAMTPRIDFVSAKIGWYYFGTLYPRPLASFPLLKQSSANHLWRCQCQPCGHSPLVFTIYYTANNSTLLY